MGLLALVLGVTVSNGQSVNDLAALSMPLNSALGSARSAAMGSAFTAVADDGSALFWNPAGLGSLTGGELSVHHQSWLAGTSRETLLAALPVENLGGFGLAAQYFDYGVFAGRDAGGTPTSSFSADQTAFQFGWGRELGEGFKLGVGVLEAQQNLGGKSYSALSTNGGILFQLPGGFTAGMAFSGLGPNVPQGDQPFAFQAGLAYRPNLSPDWKLVFAGSDSMERGELNRLQVGAEGVFRGQYSVRLGYQLDMTDTQIDGLSGLTLGAGYRFQNLALDYAYLPMGDLGDSQRLSLSYFFGTGNPPSVPTVSKRPAPRSPSPSLALQPTPTPSAGQAVTGLGPSPALLLGIVLNPTTSPVDSGDDLEIQFQLSPDTVSQGRELEKQGKIHEAIGLYTQAIQTDQKNLLAWWGLGNIYFRMGKKDFAIQCFEQVLAIKPDAVGLRLWLEKYRVAP
jgi:hypothetical protein